MTFQKLLKTGVALILFASLSACGANRSGERREAQVPEDPFNRETAGILFGEKIAKSSIADLFGPDRGDQTVQVNRFIWNASLDVLSFLPIQSVDPFTGVIVTGYGTPPGGGRSYKATVYITDPALDARSLKVALQTRGGPVSAATARAVEDAILSRARQMRIADNKL